MECVLRIGLPKTGSTSLQAALSENRPALLRHGVVYPETGTTSKCKRKHKGLHDVFRGIRPARAGMPEDRVERFKAETACAEAFRASLAYGEPRRRREAVLLAARRIRRWADAM